MNKTDARAFINQVLVYSLVMLCFTGTIGFGTVWLRHQMSVTANRTKVLQASLADTQRHIDELTAEIAAAQSPAVLQTAATRLGLAAPRESQLVHVTENALARLAAKRNQDLFNDGRPGYAGVSFRLDEGK